MNKIIKMDFWFIGLFEKFSFFTENWIGLSSTFWARLFLAAYTATGVLYVSTTKEYLKLIFIFFGFVIFYAISEKNKVTNKPDPNNSLTANEFKHDQRMSPKRLFIFGLCCILSLILVTTKKQVPREHHLMHIFLWCVWLSVMFLSCDTRPYKPSRLKEWINSLSRKPALQEN